MSPTPSTSSPRRGSARRSPMRRRSNAADAAPAAATGSCSAAPPAPPMRRSNGAAATSAVTTPLVRSRRTSSTKTGPPMSAVMIPAWISVGRSSTRPAASQAVSSTAPSSAAPGSDHRRSAPHMQPCGVGGGEADERVPVRMPPWLRRRGGRRPRRRRCSSPRRWRRAHGRVVAEATAFRGRASDDGDEQADEHERAQRLRSTLQSRPDTEPTAQNRNWSSVSRSLQRDRRRPRRRRTR